MAQKDFDAVAVAAGFCDEIAKRADEFEQAGRVAQDLVKRIAAAGLYRLCVPSALGGMGGTPLAYAEATERLARADASAAWVVFIGMTAALTPARLAPETAKALIGAPDTICAGVFAPNGRAVPAKQGGVAGFTLNGRWQWGSGTHNADVISAGGFVEAGDKDGTPDQRFFVMPARDVKLLDTWHVSGLRGTGSTDFEARDVFVPETHTLRMFGGARDDAPIFRFPPFGFLAVGIGAVALGIARASIDAFIALAHEKTPQGGRRTLAQRPATHERVARAEALLGAARIYFYERLSRAWDAAQTSAGASVAVRRDVRLATTHAVDASASAVDLMYTLAGGSSVYTRSPLQRHFRDIHVATQHMMVNNATYELAGRLFMDLETNTAQL